MAALVATALVAGCGSSSTPATATGSAAGGSVSAESAAADLGAADTTLTVFAAASLKNTFTTLGQVFQEQHPGSSVTFSFAGSSDLVAQIIAGAPADVFAAAATATMTKATDAGVVAGSPVNFAANTLTIITPPGNPAGIRTFADLAADGSNLVVCAPQVPCGSATEELETATGVTLAPVSEESSVTDVLNKVTSGEADAGLVYVTDAAAAGAKVRTIDFPESATVVNTYPIAVLTESAQPALATKFLELVTGPVGQQVLAGAGFQPAP